jgi:hypothetical protein
LQADGQAGRQADIKELTVAFRYFANALETSIKSRVTAISKNEGESSDEVKCATWVVNLQACNVDSL